MTLNKHDVGPCCHWLTWHSSLQTIIAPLNFTSWQHIMNPEETAANSSIWPLQQSYQVGYHLHLVEEKQSSMGVKLSQSLKAHEELSSKAHPPVLLHHILGPRFTLHHLLLTMTVTSLPSEAACPPHMLSQLQLQWVYEVVVHGTKQDTEIQGTAINQRRTEHKEQRKNSYPMSRFQSSAVKT